MRDNMEVITTTDKSQRDRLFQDLRQNGNELERQVVKFSGCEAILYPDGKSMFRAVQYGKPKVDRYQLRPMYRSNWSVAYPKEAV